MMVNLKSCIVCIQLYSVAVWEITRGEENEELLKHTDDILSA